MNESTDQIPRPPDPAKLVAYYRVSTRKQGESGLGLEAQVAAVAQHAETNHAVIIQEYQEVESGGKAGRPALAAAIETVKRTGAKLVIAKLDRLARSVSFTSGLMDAKVPFVACDAPYADEFTIHIYAAVAQEEKKKASERTRAALEAYRARAAQGLDQAAMLSSRKAPYKARGWVLGARIPECKNLTLAARREGNRRSAGVRAELAARHVAAIVPVAESMRQSGASLLAIADELNRLGFLTRRGNPWGPRHVLRILDRAADADAAKERELASARVAREEARERREAAARARWEALQSRRGEKPPEPAL